jgi:hypothetical protein
MRDWVWMLLLCTVAMSVGAWLASTEDERREQACFGEFDIPRCDMPVEWFSA